MPRFNPCNPCCSPPPPPPGCDCVPPTMWATIFNNTGAYKLGVYKQPYCDCMGGSPPTTSSHELIFDPSRTASRFGITISPPGVWYYESPGCFGYSGFTIEAWCSGSVYFLLMKWFVSGAEYGSTLGTFTIASCAPFLATPLAAMDGSFLPDQVVSGNVGTVSNQCYISGVSILLTE